MSLKAGRSVGETDFLPVPAARSFGETDILPVLSARSFGEMESCQCQLPGSGCWRPSTTAMIFHPRPARLAPQRGGPDDSASESVNGRAEGCRHRASAVSWAAELRGGDAVPNSRPLSLAGSLGGRFGIVPGFADTMRADKVWIHLAYSGS